MDCSGLKRIPHLPGTPPSQKKIAGAQEKRKVESFFSLTRTLCWKLADHRRLKSTEAEASDSVGLWDISTPLWSHEGLQVKKGTLRS